MSFDPVIKLILIILLVFTPLAFGSVAIWAFSLMELGILLIIVLFTLQQLLFARNSELGTRNSAIDYNSAFPIPRSALALSSLFLVLILWQMIPMPAAW